MPIYTDFGNLRRRLTQLERLVVEPDALLVILAERLVAHLEANTPVGASGKLREAMLRIRGPYDVPGGRAIGIGDMEMLIDPAISAPPHTIKEFLIWYSRQREQERRQRRAEARELEAKRRREAREWVAKKVSARIQKINLQLFRLYRRQSNLTRKPFTGERQREWDEIQKKIDELHRKRGY